MIRYIVELTPDAYSTIYTAVRLEHERLYGDRAVEPLLKEAIEQLRAYKEVTE